MREYSKVSPRFWIGETGRALRKQGQEALVVGFYLMTSPHSNMLGLFYQPLMLIAHETGIGSEGASKGLQGCIEAGFCGYDHETEMVWVYEMAAFQIAEQLAPKDNQCKGIQNEYNKLPMNPFLPAFYERYQHAYHLTAKRGERRLEPREPKPLGSPSEPPPKPGAGTGAGTEQKPKPTSSAGADGDEGEEAEQKNLKPFDRFWAVYPRRVAKAEAQKAWAKLKLDSKVDEIVQAVEAQLEGHDFKRDNGEFIPHPATWLRAGRWLDEVRPWVPPPPKLPPGWWETPDGMKAAGAMLTPPLTPNKGEFPRDFAQRIRAALGQVDAAPGAPAAAPAAGPAPIPVEAYMPPAPPPGVELTEEQRQARREETRAALGKLKQKGNLQAVGVQDPA